MCYTRNLIFIHEHLKVIDWCTSSTVHDEKWPTYEITVLGIRFFVRPHLDYNSVVWSTYSKKNEKVIEKVVQYSLL